MRNGPQFGCWSIYWISKTIAILAGFTFRESRMRTVPRDEIDVWARQIIVVWRGRYEEAGTSPAWTASCAIRAPFLSPRTLYFPHS
jgi:hypothetical protein